MAKAVSKRLSESEVGQIAARKQGGSGKSEEHCNSLLQCSKQSVIPSGRSGGGDIQSEASAACVERPQHCRMTGEPKIIAAAKINQLSPPVPDEGAIDLLQGTREGHRQKGGFCEQNCGRFRYHQTRLRKRTIRSRMDSARRRLSSMRVANRASPC